MEIRYFGHSSFLFKGKSVTLITDPFSQDMVGLKFPKHVSSDILTISHAHPDHNAVTQIEGSPFIVSGPGEYEIKGAGIIGLSTYHDDKKGAVRGKNTVYHIEIDGLNIVHLGDLGHTLSTQEVEILDGVDILCVPIGGDVTIDAQQAETIIHEIEPSIVLPMHYKHPDMNDTDFGTLAELSQFLKIMGKETIPPQPKLMITKDKIPQEMQIVILE